MKLSDITAGSRHREPLDLELPDEGGPRKITVHMRRLSMGDKVLVLERARAAAKAKGVESPAVGDPLYEHLLHVHTLAVVLVDSDSPKDDPKPFGSAEDILAHPLMTDDVIEYAYAKWEHFRDENSLQREHLTQPEMYALVATLGGEQPDALPFFRLSRDMQCRFALFTAALLWSLLRSKFSSTSPSATEGTTGSPQPDPPQAAVEGEHGDAPGA